MEASQEARVIANGETPTWEATFEHPEYGQLTFTARLPTSADWIAHSNAQHALSPGGNLNPLSAAVAAMQTFIECPVVSEEEMDDHPDGDYVKIKQVRYDPLQDPHAGFPQEVWAAFWIWLEKTLSPDTQEQVKNSSGATPGDSGDEPSPEPTASPLGMPA